MAKVRIRLARLETAARPHLQCPAERGTWSTDEDWVEMFAAWGKLGRYGTEPDFPVALAFYRVAVLRAKDQADPPFDPPSSFLPNLLDQPQHRYLYWRTHARFPEVQDGREWLYEIDGRRDAGIPPVTEGEYHDLLSWLEAHAQRLRALAAPAGLHLPWGGGRDWVGCLLDKARRGPRRVGAGEAAQAVRLLQAQHGDGA